MSKGFESGGRVALFIPGVAVVFIAISESAWGEMLAAQEARSPELMVTLMLEGEVIMAASGSKAVIVEVGFEAVLVRISDGPMAGREGWIQKEFIVRDTGGIGPDAAGRGPLDDPPAGGTHQAAG